MGADLAKVNVGEQPQLAARYDVRGIPAVKAFRIGHVVDEFVGVRPPRAVEAFFDALAGPFELDRLTDVLRERGDLPEVLPALERSDHELAQRDLLEEVAYAAGERREAIHQLMLALFRELAQEHH